MPMEMTTTGLPGVGEVPWGSHFCQFYSTAEELAGALVPFFEAGLNNNEQCVWVVSEPLRAGAAREALRSAMPDLDQRLENRQIEIIDSGEWYTRSGAEQDVGAVLDDWIARKERALALGYSGLRVSGNTCWIETRQQWRTFAEYEARVNACFCDHRIVAMCSYHLGRCSGADAIEVIRNHQFAITCDSGTWNTVESPQLRIAREELWRANRSLERRVADHTTNLHGTLRRNEAWLAGQKEAFQAAMDGAPLAISLGVLGRTAIEQAESERRCAFYIANADGTELHHVTGMPESYARCVAGFKVGPESLACGLAVSTGQPVITPDVEQEPRWQPWRWLAREHDFRGCWSFPVETATGKVVGTLAMYFRDPRDVTPRDRDLAAALTPTAAIIISRHQETEERARISRELRQSQRDLAAELAAAQQLQSISTELVAGQNAQALYEKILDAAVTIMRSDFASLQMLYPERGAAGELRLLGYRGFDPEAAKFWEWVRADSGCTCGEAMRTGRRAVASDVETCGFMAGTEDRAAYLQAGMLAAQSTPLFSRSGRLLGMLSTHWRKPCQPPESDLRRFDVLARQAADLIERAEAEAALLESEERLHRLNRDLELRVHEEIAAREAAQAQLAHAKRMEALGQLAGGIAHDFNNVIQAVQGGASLIERRSGDAERVRGLARRIMEASERGGAITRRLLAFARRGDLRASSTNMVSLLADMREILSHTLGTGIAVRMETEPDLPPVLVDKVQLETVLVNLAANARDAMQGMGTLKFAAAAETVRNDDAVPRPVALRPGAYVRLSVSDTGCGMPPEVLARATEPFFTTKGIGKGTGLGLAMAHGFAQQSGGGLAIESTVGRGTVIRLWLPVAESTTVAIASHDDGASRAVFEDTRGRLLLVDDDEFVRETLAQEMEAEGYAVLPVASGTDALSLLDSGEPFDLIISDLSMRGMDGVSLIRAAQRRQPRLPAILLTGFSAIAGTALEAAVSGTLTLLRKPVQGRQLAERVAILLEGAAVAGGDMRNRKSLS